MEKNKRKPTYLNTTAIMERWGCDYGTALAFMHRRGSGAIKPAGRLLINESEVEEYEQAKRVRPAENRYTASPAGMRGDRRPKEA
ncbi:MAG: hypothetical protein FWE90_01210 [Defluviitaleaceae bacterium]|nr:hypothetical protein [Defluviitaleaceae bacterium]